VKTSYPFLQLPFDPKYLVRPVVPFSFRALPGTKLLGLVDSGSAVTRIDDDWAQQLGIDLSQAEVGEFKIAGHHYVEKRTTVELRVGPHQWEAEVAFVEGWRHSHQILGIKGFFDRFIVRVDGLDEHTRLIRNRRRPQ
jgi:hypothetical protein